MCHRTPAKGSELLVPVSCADPRSIDATKKRPVVDAGVSCLFSKGSDELMKTGWNVACVYNDGGRVRQRHRSLDQQDQQGNQVNQENHGTYTEALRTADRENSVAHNLSGPLTDEVFTNTGQHPSLLVSAL